MKERLTSLSEEPHAKGSVQLENEKDYQMKEAFYACPIADFFKRCVPDGSYGKMYLVFSAQMGETTSNCFYKKFRRQGILAHGECWTLDMCVWTDSRMRYHSEENGYLLQDILEDNGNIPQRYYLSDKTKLGILRRAAIKGRKLPEDLKTILEMRTDMKG